MTYQQAILEYKPKLINIVVWSSYGAINMLDHFQHFKLPSIDDLKQINNNYAFYVLHNHDIVLIYKDHIIKSIIYSPNHKCLKHIHNIISIEGDTKYAITLD